MLNPEMLPRLQQLLADADLDGWLLYDFRGTNAIASGLLGFEGLVSRRVFAFANGCYRPASQFRSRGVKV